MSIKIDLKIFVFILIFFITKQIKIYTLLMFFAFIHELAHLVMGIIMGLKPESIRLSIYGFSISYKTECDDYNKKIKKGNFLSIKKIMIALAGPAINLIIILFTLIYYRTYGVSKLFNVNIDQIIYANILLVLFNMIPIYPLDGGRILKEIIYIYEGLEKSYTSINLISNISLFILTVFASFFIMLFQNISVLLIIVYLWTLVINNNKQIKKIQYILQLCKNEQKNT